MSTSQYRVVPTYTTQLSPGQHNNNIWYRYFQQNEQGAPPSSETAISVTASPFSFTAPVKGFVIVSGGTVSAIMFSRSAGVFYLTGQTSGTFTLAQNDVLKVTYSGKPTMTFVPT